MKISYFVLIACLAISLRAMAHGEDKPGPHGGHIRMPGAFHTEVVLTGKNRLKVYLLDLYWKNASVTDSSIVVNLGNRAKAICTKNQDFFLCSFSESIDLTQPGRLEVESMRQSQRGNKVQYDLPLKFEPVPEGHQGSH